MAASDRVVVLGGAGFIGRSLIELLKGTVSSLKVVSRRAGGYTQPGVEYLDGDVGDERRVRDLVEGATAVYQLTVEEDIEEGARRVAEACVQHNVRRLIYASSSDALDLRRKGTILESEGPDPRPDLRNSYSRGKGRAERLLLRHRSEHGLGVVIVRPCLVVGRGGRLAHGGIGSWASPTCCLGWGSGRNPIPFVLVGDVARGLQLALDAPGIEGRAFNLGGDVFLSAREYVDLVARHARRDFRFRPRNLAWLCVRSSLRSLAIRLAGHSGDGIASYRDMRSSQMLTQIDNRQSKALLGWRPNDDLDVFVREAIGCHLEPFAPGDLRYERTSTLSPNF